jgi:hypothetical protein
LCVAWASSRAAIEALAGRGAIAGVVAAPVICAPMTTNGAPLENGGIGLVIVESTLSTDQCAALHFNCKPA